MFVTDTVSFVFVDREWRQGKASHERESDGIVGVRERVVRTTLPNFLFWFIKFVKQWAEEGETAITTFRYLVLVDQMVQH